MKKFIYTAALVMVTFLGLGFTVTPISQYPNDPAPQTNYLFLLTIPGVTNENITVIQLMAFTGTNSTLVNELATNSALITGLLTNPVFSSYAAAFHPAATNIIYPWSAFPSPTNFLPLNNSYWKLSTTNNCAITNLSGTGSWATLLIQNTNASSSITVSVSPGTAGVNSTNLLTIPAGKRGVISFLTDDSSLTNYVTTTFQ